jgi:hypothetical protein
MMLKRCSACKEMKPLDQFSKRSDHPVRRQSRCKKCTTIYNKEYRKNNKARLLRHTLLWQYKMTPEEYDKLLEKQEGKCAGCLVEFTFELNKANKHTAPHVDHDHLLGYSRGLLCHSCNVTLGLVKDSPGTLRRLATYIEDWEV